MLTKQQKASYRRKMIFIIGDRSVEDLPKSDLRRVQKIGRLIGSPIMDHSKPLEPIDFYSFTYYDYMSLIDEGYSVKAIVNALGISKYRWMNWRLENAPAEEEAECLK
ncbi:hypothetical protein FQS90_12365 [Enterococcus casseliflavus]|uniref:hypothetical protein n=1 Tax=Enterococcus sp. 8E11_MSG4843 TaxID=1834190 RepID=UPI000B3EC66D|nr:hypothetical protein [Enterococcus sp. 8E11_MSG4843]MBO1097313.1 hypothetical protein [Enterococcus casseliflavus]MBO1144438.1 hypothetical protein [Enterococcus casseliflavus]OUZ36130.1 hypothetical protein A5885_000315 [Enterococcus sp. 8E11_MSG4843]